MTDFGTFFGLAYILLNNEIEKHLKKNEIKEGRL